METESLVITSPVSAIVSFGPPSATDGFRPGFYYQVVIDPNMVSPGGDFIRFDSCQGGELQGWQRVEAITVWEVLGDVVVDPAKMPEGYTPNEKATVTMRAIERG
jgi:hypothetical protein